MLDSTIYEITGLDESLSSDEKVGIVRSLYENRGLKHFEKDGKDYIVIKQGLDEEHVVTGVRTRLMGTFFDRPIIKDILKILEDDERE